MLNFKITAINPKKLHMVRKFFKKVPLHNVPSMTVKPPQYLSAKFNEMIEKHHKTKNENRLRKIRDYYLLNIHSKEEQVYMRSARNNTNCQLNS